MASPGHGSSLGKFVMMVVAMDGYPEDPAAWTADARAALIGELLAGRLSLEDARRRYGIPGGTLEAWRRRFIAGARAALDDAAELRALKRERTHRQLGESEARFHAFIAQTSEAVWSLEHVEPISPSLSVEVQIERILDGVVVVCNEVCARFFGAASADELLGKTLRETTPHTLGEAGLKRFRSLLRVFVTSGYRIIELEDEVLAPDGTVRWTVNNAHGVIEDGHLVHTWGTLRDITKRRQVEKALVRAKEEWERTFDAVPELIVLTDEELRVVRLNRACSNRLGVEPRKLIGKHCFQVIDVTAAAMTDALPRLESAAPGSSETLELRSESLGGEFLFSISPRYDDEGRVIGRTFVGRDVTAQRQIEEMVRRSAMIDQVEQIFRTIRHELGNALNTLKTTLSVLRSRCEDFTPTEREIYLNRSMDTFKVAERLLKALKDYQHFDELAPCPIDLCGFLDDTAGLLEDNAGKEGIGCELEIHDRPLRIHADRDALLRILFNLVDNAVAATAGCPDPRIIIGCRRIRSQAMVSVRDNGQGISRKHLARVFTPLFTTKKEGSGIGLAVVQRLMLQMSGVARIRSEVGRGTTVELVFPLLPQS